MEGLDQAEESEVISDMFTVTCLHFFRSSQELDTISILTQQFVN